ncbi:MAG TPA: AgmX/PglI C-terminal domain-containing protein [Myxococcota bacterium]
MDPIAPQDERALREQLDRARSKLDGLVRDLRAADDELASLCTERKQHQLLGRACDALEELSAQGAARLFWGDRVAGDEEQLRGARARADAFEKYFAEIEEKRQELLEQVLLQDEGMALLSGDVLELERLAQEREHEWIVEREISEVPARSTLLPWSRGAEEDSRFRRSLAAALAASVAFALVAHGVDLPLPELPLEREQPRRLTRLIETPRPLPSEPRVAEPEPQRLPQALAKAESKQPPPERRPEPDPGKGTTEGSQSGPKGLLAFRERLSGVAALRSDARFGLSARISSSGDSPSGPPTRSMITTSAPGSSGGINLASLSRGGSAGGRGMQGVQVARVTSAIAGSGGGGGAAGENATGRGGPPLGRTDEEIQIVFDRHKAELYRLYNRELRSDPTLQGQIVLRMTIEPDGSVSRCALQATDMDAPRLAAQVVERVRAFDFGAKEGIAAVTILYPIEFLPAT